MSTPTTTTTTFSPLLALPLELRHIIYSHLTPSTPVIFPFSQPPIVCITHLPPPSALQRTCRSLYHEIMSYFWGLATLRFITQNSSHIQRRRFSPATLLATRRARRLEMRFYWDLSVQIFGGVEQAELKGEWKAWIEEAVVFLREAGCLKRVVISVSDASDKGVGWEVKKRLLEQLRGLKDEVVIVVGEVYALHGDEEGLKQRIREWVRGV